MAVPEGTQQSGYAGDVTPAQAWELLRENPDAVLVDVRTRAEWQFVGVPDASELGRRVRFIEWIDFPSGNPNPGFVEQLRAELQDAVAGESAGAGAESGGGPEDETAKAPVLFLCRSGGRSIGAATVATSAGLGPAYNVLEGFEGGRDARGHRGAAGWRAAGLPWCQS